MSDNTTTQQKLILYKNENDFDEYISNLLDKYNDEHKCEVSLSQIKGLVAVETGFNTDKNQIGKIIDRFFKLFKKYEYRGLQKVISSWQSGSIEKVNGVLVNQLYVDDVYAHINFYFLRDVLNEQERAQLQKERIMLLEARMLNKQLFKLISGVLVIIVCLTMIYLLTIRREVNG